jgi:hypothetical protein
MVVMSADHAREQSEQQEPVEGRKHALILFLLPGSHGAIVKALGSARI